MKRLFVVAITALALLVPTLTFAQVKTVYIPGTHPRVVVVQPETPSVKVERAPLTHCDRLVAEARATLRKNF